MKLLDENTDYSLLSYTAKRVLVMSVNQELGRDAHLVI